MFIQREDSWRTSEAACRISIPDRQGCHTPIISLHGLVSDNQNIKAKCGDKSNHRKRIMISIISDFDIGPFRWYFRFLLQLSLYFIIMVSKNLQKSSSIQNISLILSSMIIAKFICNILLFKIIKVQSFSQITNFLSTYNLSNSRNSK